MTRATGWLGYEPDEQDQGGQAPAMPTSTFLLAHRATADAPKTLEQALARTAAVPDRPDPEVLDPDERAAGMISRGYQPGRISRLTQQLADVSVALAAEQERLDQDARRAEHLAALHQAGRISAFDVMRLTDAGEGGEGESLAPRPSLDQLERQQASLRQQLDEAHGATSPPEPRQVDGVEAAAQRAHEIFREVTRQRRAEAEAGVRRSEPRPFASASRFAGRSTEHTGADCWVCREGGRLAASDRDTSLSGAGTGYPELVR